MISFSAGFPSPDSYPIDQLADATNRVMTYFGREAMGYCPTSGNQTLRQLIQKRLREKFNLEYHINEILITNGSQQGIDMSALLFLNPGDVVLFEVPAYLGAVNALQIHQAQMVAVAADGEGIDLEDLGRQLNRYQDRVKMVYVCPDHQNPTGKSWSENRRRTFMDLMRNWDIPILEDAAYSELSFDQQTKPQLASYDWQGQVIYMGTFSKIFCPGLRVAWLCGRDEVINQFLLLKNTADLSSCTLAQYVMADYLAHYDMEKHIASITKLYRHRRDLMLQQLDRFLPAGVQYVIPEGGLYIWLTLPDTSDVNRILKQSLEQKVSFVEGKAFYPDGERNHEIRLNFSNMQDEETIRGIEILAEIIRNHV